MTQGEDPGAVRPLLHAQKRIDCNKLVRSSAASPEERVEMSKPVGSQAPEGVLPERASLKVAKKKGCKQHKCSKWKGGKCRCGRE
jgi:hypothetical protein